jgi:Domain of unknown function (DUF4314)
MNKSNKELNPKLVKGDRIMCLHMEGETSVPMGTTGTVGNVGIDPFEQDNELIQVRWDNGSSLALVSASDTWVKIAQETLEEQTGSTSEYDFFNKNPEIFNNFDWRFLREFLNKLREAGPVNMFQSQPFLYSGKEWIDRYYGENQEDNEDFQEVLEMADEAKNKMIQGVLKYMKSEGIEIEIDKVNSLMGKFATKILQFYISFF